MQVAGLGSSGLSSLYGEMCQAGLSKKERDFCHEMLEDMESIDSELYNHSANVFRYALRISEVFGLNTRQMGLGGMTHDIGKIWTPQSILKKQSKPSNLEFKRIKKHPKVGGKELSKYGFTDAADIAYEHHMHQSNFYPKKKADMNPLSSFVSLADWYVASFRKDGYDCSGEKRVRFERDHPSQKREIGILYDAGVFA